jgi:hypothetical protein
VPGLGRTRWLGDVGAGDGCHTRECWVGTCRAVASYAFASSIDPIFTAFLKLAAVVIFSRFVDDL